MKHIFLCLCTATIDSEGVKDKHDMNKSTGSIWRVRRPCRVKCCWTRKLGELSLILTYACYILCWPVNGREPWYNKTILKVFFGGRSALTMKWCVSSHRSHHDSKSGGQDFGKNLIVSAEQRDSLQLFKLCRSPFFGTRVMSTLLQLRDSKPLYRLSVTTLSKSSPITD